jgi:outer membrane protein assembly factor BamB
MIRASLAPAIGASIGAAAARTLAGGAALSLMLAFTGCAWLTGKEEKPPAPLPEFRASVSAGIAWQQPLNAAGQPGFTPVTSGGNLYAATPEGTLVAYDAKSGRERWKVPTGLKLSAGVGADAGVVVAGTAKGDVLAYDDTGKSLWKSRVSSEVLGPPKVADKVVVVWSGDGSVFGLSTADGSRRWVQQRTIPALSVRNQAGGLLAKGGVFLGVAGGKLLAIDLDRGLLGWEGTVAQPKGTTELERIADITSLPAISATMVCAAAYQGRVACFEPNRGTFLWSRDIASKEGVLLDNRHLYVTDDKGAIHALDKDTGASVWKQDKLVTRAPTAPQLIGDYLAVVDLEGFVHVLNRNDGSLVGRVATDGSASTAQPVASDEAIVFQTRRGNVFSIVVR